MQYPIRHWLSLRIRLLCVAVFLLGSLLPPYVPRDALALEGEAEVDLPQFLLVEDGFLMKSSSLTKQGARLAYSEGIVHVVQGGDSLEKIADRYGISVDTLKWVNKLESGTPIRPGQELVVLPVNGVLHVVTRGQTLSRIAELYAIPEEEIARQNALEGGFILAGQELIIPGGRPIVAKPTEIAQKPPVPGSTMKPGTTATISAPGKAPPQVAPAVATIGVLQMPCNNCFYTQYYHPGHYAVDIQTRGGGPIFAAEEGIVIRAEEGWNGGYGNVVEVDHGNDLISLYAHNKEFYVKVGERVTRGQLISWMGNTGRVYGKTGVHVHFEVRVAGVKKNPVLYLK